MVETTIILAMLSTTFFEEYSEPTKYVKTALGIEHWINNTPAANPDKSKVFMIVKPIIGPIITLANDEIKADLKENTLNLVNAIPKDVKIKKIAA